MPDPHGETSRERGHGHVAALQNSPSAGPGDFLDALEEGIYGIDLEGRCTFANRAAVSALGYDGSQDLLGRDMHELIHHTRPDGTRYDGKDCPILSTLQTTQPVLLENEMLWRRDGTSFFAEYSSVPLMAAGSFVGAVITFRDLTHSRSGRNRIAIQHALSQVMEADDDPETASERIVAAAGSGFGWDAGILWALDPSGGLKRSAVWGPPELLRQASAGREVVVRGEGLVGAAWAGEKTVVSVDAIPDGDAPVPDVAGHRVAFPLRADGRVVGVLEYRSRLPVVLDGRSLVDLSTLGRQIGQFISRRQAEANLRDSEALQSAIMDAALDCVVVVDADTRIRAFNPAAERTFGRTRADALGKELGALILPADFLIGHLQKFARFLDEGDVSAVNRHVEVEAERANGERFPAELSVTPLKVAGEALFAAYLRDITERRRAADQVAAARTSAEAARVSAEEANRAKSDFIANMSHELRTPLSAIIGYGEMMREEMEDGVESRELAPDMQKIENNARHLLGLINDVLDLSKIESGRMEVFLETFDVEPMVRDVASTVTSLIEKNANTLSVAIGPGLGSMRSDMTKLKQMLLNLLSNAAKFTNGGTITLTADRSAAPGSDRLRFSVRDTGLGMTEEQRAKLFQRYMQADTSTASKYGGTGLGLSISRAFAVMLGGGIEVTSQPGHGSVFTIELPAETSAAQG